MADSPNNSPSKPEPRARKSMMELRSNKTATVHGQPVQQPLEETYGKLLLDRPESPSRNIGSSSSTEDLIGSIDADRSRGSVEPEDLSQSQDQSTSRRNSSFVEKQPETPQKDTKNKTESADSSNSNIWPLIVAGVAICLVAMAISWPSKPAQVKQQHCDEFVTKLRPKYPSVDPIMWTTLNVSVNRALYRKPGEPSTFVFLYDSDTVQKPLVEDIVAVTSQCFHETRPIRLTSADFQTPEIAADYSAFLHQYKQPLEERGIMVVQDLDQIPAKAARALFTICDSYGPLVERAVIFFTIDISKRAEGATGQSPTEIAEKLLQDQWRGGLKWDTLNPLVVRLTENVFKII